MKPIKHLRSALFGGNLGRCGRCRLKWNVVEYHTTNYDRSGGCFPLCEDCWRELLTAEARLPYYMRLMDLWQSSGSPDHNGIPWPTLRALVMSAVVEESVKSKE